MDEQSRYRELRILGQGGMGRVLLVEDLELNRLAALKEIHGEDDGTAGARLAQEARALAAIRHPHVVQLYDYAVEGPRPFLLLEYVIGKDLRQMLAERGRLDVATVRRLADELGSAIDALHAGNLQHRDIKPANVMVREEDGGAALMDFGLARDPLRTQMTQAGRVVGTPRYFPPEVALQGEWVNASDWFQLGAVLFECLTGQFLVRGRTIDERLRCSRAADWTPFPASLEIPTRYRETISRLVNADPDRRLQGHRELVEALDGAAGARGRGPSTPLAPPTLPSRSPKRTAAAILGAMLLGSLAGGWAFRGPPRQPAEVDWQILGDALVVSFDPAGALDPRLEIDGVPVTPEVNAGGGRHRSTFRGLSGTRPISAQLVWSTGRSKVRQVLAGQPAIETRAALAAERQLEVRVRRPCVAWWRGRPQRRFALEPGMRRLTLPEDHTWFLILEEDSLFFELAFDREDLLSRTAGRVSAVAVDFHAARHALRRGGAAGVQDLEPADQTWRQVVDWLPDIFDGGPPSKTRRGLWKQWRQWRRILALREAKGERGVRLSPGFGRTGHHGSGLPEWRGKTELKIQLETGSEPAPGGSGGVLLRTKVSGLLPGTSDAAAQKDVRFVWPAMVPRSGHRVALAVRVRELPADCGVRIHIGSRIDLWHPAPADGTGELYAGWLHAVFPGSLLPEVGEEVRIRLLPLDLPVSATAVLEEVRVSWVPLD